MATIRFYEGSYQFKSETTDLSVNPSYIEYCLAKQYEYRPTKEVLWAELEENGIKSRFSFTYGKTIEQYIFWKFNIAGASNVTKRSKVIGENKTHFRVLFDEQTGMTSDVCKTLVC